MCNATLLNAIRYHFEPSRETSVYACNAIDKLNYVSENLQLGSPDLSTCFGKIPDEVTKAHAGTTKDGWGSHTVSLRSIKPIYLDSVNLTLVEACKISGEGPDSPQPIQPMGKLRTVKRSKSLQAQDG